MCLIGPNATLPKMLIILTTDLLPATRSYVCLANEQVIVLSRKSFSTSRSDPVVII